MSYFLLNYDENCLGPAGTLEKCMCIFKQKQTMNKPDYSIMLWSVHSTMYTNNIYTYVYSKHTHIFIYIFHKSHPTPI